MSWDSFSSKNEEDFNNNLKLVAEPKYLILSFYFKHTITTNTPTAKKPNYIDDRTFNINYYLINWYIISTIFNKNKKLKPDAIWIIL